MKNKKKILSLLACLSLLTSCNKSTPYSSSCKTTTSTPSVNPTPIEPIDLTKYIKVSKFTNTKDNLYKDKLQFEGFNDELTDEMKLKVTEFAFPETINVDGKEVELVAINKSIFKGFNNLKKVKIPRNIVNIIYSLADFHTPFTNLPSLEEIEIDNDNKYYYVKDNCLIEKEWTVNDTGDRELTGDLSIIGGYKDVIIPNEVITVRNGAFMNNQSVTSIKLNPNITKIENVSSFKCIENLESIDLNGNTNFVIDGNCLLDANRTTIYSFWGDVTIPKGWTGSFNPAYYYSVKSVTIPSNATITIPKSAFVSTKTETINILSNTVTIESGVFNYANHNPYDSSQKFSTHLTNVTVNQDNPKYKAENGCLYSIDSSSLTPVDVLGIYSENVTIPEGITTIVSEGISYTKNPLKSIKFPSTINTIADSAFAGIDAVNNNFKVSFPNDNPTYRVESNCIIKSTTDGDSVVFAFPNDEGNVVVPSSATIFDSKSFIYESLNATKLIFNEGLKQIGSNTEFSQSNVITELELPSTLEKITYTPFQKLSKITKVTVKEGNPKLYVDEVSSCLIYRSGSDNVIVFAWGDVVISKNTGRLYANSVSNNFSITSLTLYSDISSIGASSFKNINGTSNLKSIVYKGTLEDFKKTRHSDGYSIYSNLKVSQNKNVSVTYYDVDGVTEITTTMGEL